MNKQEMMEIFEKECANWGFDFSKDDSGPNGLVYVSYETGVMFGMFDKGFEVATEHFGVKK